MSDQSKNDLRSVRRQSDISGAAINASRPLPLGRRRRRAVTSRRYGTQTCGSIDTPNLAWFGLWLVQSRVSGYRPLSRFRMPLASLMTVVVGSSTCPSS
jgi:hypothetical protein